TNDRERHTGNQSSRRMGVDAQLSESHLHARRWQSDNTFRLCAYDPSKESKWQLGNSSRCESTHQVTECSDDSPNCSGRKPRSVARCSRTDCRRYQELHYSNAHRIHARYHAGCSWRWFGSSSNRPIDPACGDRGPGRILTERLFRATERESS